MDVLEELVRDNIVMGNFTLATNGTLLQMIRIQTLQLTLSFNDSDNASIWLPGRSSCIMLDFFNHQLNADSRVCMHIHTYISTYTHYIKVVVAYWKVKTPCHAHGECIN